MVSLSQNMAAIYARRLGCSLAAICLTGFAAFADPVHTPETIIPETIIYGSDTQFMTPDIATPAGEDQEYCIGIMANFPNKDETQRYAFFRLIQDLAIDATPELKQAISYTLEQIDAPQTDATTPLPALLEDIANPVFRQVAPELIAAHMAHLIDFSQRCDSYISGQINSLLAFDPSLAASHQAIGEDALYMRQILAESLQRLGADQGPYAYHVQAYDLALVRQRDQAEFAAFETEISELETLYMDDLDGRLARSNDIINSEMDREVLDDALGLNDDLNEAAKKSSELSLMETLIYILQ